MKKLLFTIVSAVCLAVSALAQDGLFINVDPVTKTFFFSGAATGEPRAAALGASRIYWRNDEPSTSDDWAPLGHLFEAFVVSGNRVSDGFEWAFNAAGHVNANIEFQSDFGFPTNPTTLTGNPTVLYDYSDWSAALQAELEQKAADSEILPVTEGDPAFALTFRTAGLFINVDPVTKTYFLSGTATGVPVQESSYQYVIYWDNWQAYSPDDKEEFISPRVFTAPSAFTVTGNSAFRYFESFIHAPGNVNIVMAFTLGNEVTLTGNPDVLLDYSNWSPALIAKVEQKAADGETVGLVHGSPSFALTFRLANPVSVDTGPPTIAVPDDIIAVASSKEGAVVNFSVSANDDVDGSVPVICDPPSGSLFPPGATTVTCTATDAARNTATETFVVWVSYAWSGILQPINADGSSVFKTGRTVPVKFHLAPVKGVGARVARSTRRAAAGVLACRRIRIGFGQSPFRSRGWRWLLIRPVRRNNRV